MITFHTEGYKTPASHCILVISLVDYNFQPFLVTPLCRERHLHPSAGVSGILIVHISSMSHTQCNGS